MQTVAVLQISKLPTKQIYLIYRKVASSRLSRLVAHTGIFRLFMKGNFDAYVLWPLDKMVQNWIVDLSIPRNFTALKIKYRWNLWLNYHTYIHHKNFLLKTIHAKEVIFITEFAILWRKPPFYRVKCIFQKKALGMEGFPNITNYWFYLKVSRSWNKIVES